jgi:hypothetical protein
VKIFYSSDPTSWVTQMEHYLSLHGIIDGLAKLLYSVLYLDPKCWQWWKWCRTLFQGYVSLIFMDELYEHFDIGTHSLGHLIK